MLTVEYSEKGVSMADADVQEYVDKTLEDYKASSLIGFKDTQVIVSNQIVIECFRLAIKQNKISSDKIVFVFEGKELFPRKDGRLDYWPTGFCDLYDSFLEKLVFD